MKKHILKIIILLISLSAIIYVIFTPHIVLIGPNKIELEVNSQYQDDGIIVYNLKKDKIKIENSLNTNKIGEYTIKYIINNKYKKTRKILVIDKTKPIIKLNGEQNTNVCSYSKYKEEGATATDNYDGDISSQIKVKKSKNKIIYSVEDSSSNKTEKIRNLILKDDEAPIIKLNGNNYVYMYLGEKYEEQGVTAIDNCDGDISSQIKKSGNVDTNNIGEYKIKYEVRDSSYNKSEVERIIKVIPNNDKVIYLTFDDGPSIDITPKILDLLKKYNIKATFFVIGHDNSINYLIKRIFDEGHTIGTHTYSHSYKKVYESDEAFLKEVEKINNKVEMITGTKTNIIRFPGGSSNTVSKNYSKDIMTRLTKKVHELGYRYFDWNVGSNDTSTQDSNKICKNVIKGLNKGTNIVLMHDFAGHEGTYEALPCIIEYATKNGYTFSKITKDTKEIHHKVAN